MLIKSIICSFLIFMAGFVAAMNVTRLIPPVINYEASWGKVGLAVFFAAVFWAHTQET